MAEQVAKRGAIEIAYETFGDPASPPLLLVMGLASQMILWDDEFCQMFVERGFHVIRFDNRDVGRSTHIRGGPKPKLLRAMAGITRDPHYTLEDMADDALGLLDHLGIGGAHVAGASMGGMIAQTMAIRRPERVLSLASIMSTTGNRRAGMPRLRALAVLLRRAPRDRDSYVDYVARTFEIIGSPGFDRDEASVRKLAAESYDRGVDRGGPARQIVAVQASGDRTTALAGVRAPTVVIHGTDDPLIPIRAGRATARAIPGAELIEIEGMGHDLPREVWPRIVDGVARNAARAEHAPAEEGRAAWR
ncbi:MAG TPA: alpha/beta fold hydrolase [Thermoleophilaceae bacterium]|nr:alpha/beta fold hydrolase [Thermoleophilaceae bacterium]